MRPSRHFLEEEKGQACRSCSPNKPEIPFPDLKGQCPAFSASREGPRGRRLVEACAQLRRLEAELAPLFDSGLDDADDPNGDWDGERPEEWAC